jgi:hypothetical protein
MSEREIINTHDQLVAAGGGVALIYLASTAGQRGGMGARFHVYRIGADGRQRVTDPNAHWSDSHCKTFHVFVKSREEQLAAAQAWVAEQGWYTGLWARNRMGDYVPADIHKRFPLRPIRRTTGGAK